MKTDPWINYGKATGISLLCCFTYFFWGVDGLGGGHGVAMVFLVWMGISILIVLINFLYMLPGRWLSKIKYCLPALLIIPCILTAEDKPVDLISFANPFVGLVYLPLLINALFSLYFFIKELTEGSVNKKV